MKRFLKITGVLVLLAGGLNWSAQAQNEKHDSIAIARVKAISVSKLERKLPTTRFSSWLTRLIKPSKPIEWEVNDCGEQDGSGNQPDFPICVQASGLTRDQIQVTVFVTVGSHKRGLIGSPKVWGVWLTRGRDLSIGGHTLGDLAGNLKKLQRTDEN
ncbi:MAG: hypothetical protein WBO10_00830 [Pyrinomonadaceae bacterium]